MSMYSEGWSPADALAMVGGRNNGDGGLFGGEGIVGLIALIIISGMFGFGGFGMGGMGGMMPWLLMSGGFGGFGGFGGAGNGNAATQADIQRAVDQQTLISKIDQQTYGISQATYDINNTLQNGFSSAELSRCNQQAALMQQLYQMGYNQQDCCCQTQRAIDGVNYNMATNTCALQNTMNNNTRDVIDSQRGGVQAILEKLCQMEYNGLNDKYQAAMAENQALRLAASQSTQNAVLMAAMDANKAEILRRTGAECPTAAYIVQPPTPVTFATNCNGQATFGNDGCNNGCRNCY